MSSESMFCGWSWALRSPTRRVGTALVAVVVGVGWAGVGMVVVRSCDSCFQAASLSSCGLSLWGKYAATVLSGDSAVSMVAVINLPLIGLRSVSAGVMRGAAIMEIPAWDRGPGEVSAL